MAKFQKITSVKGMEDILPPHSELWQSVEQASRSVFSAYGYKEIRTPIVEKTELFRRGVGETTSIVEKEMYSFVDRGDDSLTLRPEGTASVVRAYIESGSFVSEPIARYYYMGPMFRRERPQKGRQRQFHQIGCEIFGVASPLADAEVVAMTSHLFEEIGCEGLQLEVNSIGCPDCRPSFETALMNFLGKNEAALCDDCKRRMGRNPMRVLDCKNPACRELVERAPRLPDHWCLSCREHFGSVKRALDLVGVKYVLNDRIVRGLDYYMRTAFEFTTTRLGAQSAVAAGGRYDGLVKELGGPAVPGVGFALGMERLALLLEGQEGKSKPEDLVFFAVLGEAAQDAALPIIQTLRRDGVRVEWDYAERSLKSQMRRAAKVAAETVVIIGDEEVARGVAQVRDMRKAAQHEVRIQDLPRHFVQIVG